MERPDCFGYHKGCGCQDCRDIDEVNELEDWD